MKNFMNWSFLYLFRKDKKNKVSLAARALKNLVIIESNFPRIMKNFINSYVI